MLSATFAPLTNFTDDLLSAIAEFLRPVIIQFSPRQLGSVAALQLELALTPLRIIAGATMGIQGGNQNPPETLQPLARQQTERDNRIATIDWLRLDEPAPDNEPIPNIIDMAKARQQRELPAESSPIPTDAFTLFGADGRFEVKESEAGYVVYRWVTLKKGLKVSQHIIPNGGSCNCKQSTLGRICCHQKAIDHHIEAQRIAETVAGWKEQERAQRVEAFRFQVIVWRDGHDEAEIFWEGASLDDAEFKLKIASEKLDINTAKIYDRQYDSNLKFYRRFETQAQVEDARQALGFSTPKPTGDWQSRQELEDSIVEAAAKLGWLPAQCTAFQKSTLGLPMDSKITRDEMTAEQLQMVADAFALALKERQTEKRRQAALKSRKAG